MPNKTYTIELPTEFLTPPEHFTIEIVSVVSVHERSEVRNKDFKIKGSRDALGYAVLAYSGILDDFVLRLSATDGVSCIYSVWDTGNAQWSGWYDEDSDEPADFAKLAYLRAVDARAKLLYEKQQGNRKWVDCLEQAETEICDEISAAADAQRERNSEIIAVTNQAIEEAQGEHGSFVV